MSLFVVAGLLLGSPVATDAHRIAMDHRGQNVDVTYRSAVAVEHKQIGSAGPGGRPNTLQCAWKAKVSVQREARSAAGHVLARTIASDAPLEGRRAGWCSGQREAIAQDVAARSEAVRAHLLAVAERDREALALELDAAHSPARS